MKSTYIALLALTALVVGGCSHKGTDPPPVSNDTPKFVSSWSTWGADSQALKGPFRIDCDKSGNVYVIDGNFPKVLNKFSREGEWIWQCGIEASAAAITCKGPAIYILQKNNFDEYNFDGGGGGAQIAHGIEYICWENNWPKGMAFAEKSGPFWVNFIPVPCVDRDTVDVLKAHWYCWDCIHDDKEWNLWNVIDGQYGCAANIPLELPDNLGDIACGPETVMHYGTRSFPAWPVYVIAGDHIYKYAVAYICTFPADPYNYCMDIVGLYQLKWGGTGSEDGKFDEPVALDCDKYGNVYVLDRGNHRVQKFDEFGTFITKWGTEGTGNGQFAYPTDIAIDSAGNIYITDRDNGDVQKFR